MQSTIQDLFPETEGALNLPEVSEIAWLIFKRFACSLGTQIPTAIAANCSCQLPEGSEWLLSRDFLLGFHLSSAR